MKQRFLGDDDEKSQLFTKSKIERHVAAVKSLSDIDFVGFMENAGIISL